LRDIDDLVAPKQAQAHLAPTDGGIIRQLDRTRKPQSHVLKFSRQIRDHPCHFGRIA
jgi:hypothetical protein